MYVSITYIISTVFMIQVIKTGHYWTVIKNVYFLVLKLFYKLHNISFKKNYKQAISKTDSFILG